jgi:pimeloyl-ACP methyl ester carboxylesterase
MKDWWQDTFPKGRQTLTITDANGYPVKIAYGEKGTGKPLFLLHGIGSWSYSWRYSVELLSKHFRTICFDAKGHGFSDKPHYSEAIGHQIIETKRIIESLCNQPAIIVAESLGALISLAVAEEYPELIEQLIVINVPIFPERLPSRGMRFLSALPIEMVRIFDRLRLALLFAPLLWQVIAIERREIVANPENITFEEIYWGSYPYLKFPNTITKYTEILQLSANEIELLLQNQPNIIRKIQENLPKITCPTLILWGEQDSWFPVSNGEQLHSHLPNSRFKVLPNCGHKASDSCPEAVNAAIVEFLQAC